MTLSDRLRQMREAAAPKERIRAVDLLRRSRREPEAKTGSVASYSRLKRKTRRGRVIDKEYIAWAHRTHGCLLAEKGFGGCSGVKEFHHVRKCGEPKNDRRGFLLCTGHHREGPKAIHKIKRRWEALFGISIEAEIERYQAEFNERPA